jgi:transcriptional regulator with XRE-family HTH domain/ADP-ribose pyrophosphatase YjhB (NUDIX family)
MKFDQLLRNYRKKAGIRQKELSAVIGIDATYLSKIENGKRNPPDRDVVLEIADALDLNESQKDELLVSAGYQPQTLFDMGFDTNDVSLKKHIGVLKDIRKKAPLASYIRAKEEISDYLEVMRTKYTGKIDEELAKNTLLADYLYSKVRRGGLKALYQEVNRPLGGAIVMHEGKILLHRIGISPVKGWWLIPMGYVNPDKGDRTAKDIAIRMVRRCLGNVDLEVVKELTAEGEILEDLDTTESSVKLGWFPAVVQVYEIKLKTEGKVKLSKGGGFYKLTEFPKLSGGVHPIMAQIVRNYFKDKKIAKTLYLKSEESIERVLAKKNYYEDMIQFDRKRRRKKL